jgi:hypothetical protein
MVQTKHPTSSSTVTSWPQRGDDRAGHHPLRAKLGIPPGTHRYNSPHSFLLSVCPSPHSVTPSVRSGHHRHRASRAMSFRGILLRRPRCPGFTTPSMASQPSPAIHGRPFVRFDEITDLVEKAPDLTLARRRRVKGATSTRLPDPRHNRPSRPLRPPCRNGKTQHDRLLPAPPPEYT